MLQKLKAVAYRAKLNCGHCAVAHKLEDGEVKINRCAEGPYCCRWFLHKFRHTYATRHLQDGIDIRTLQQWMGHRDRINDGLPQGRPEQRRAGADQQGQPRGFRVGEFFPLPSRLLAMSNF